MTTATLFDELTLPAAPAGLDRPAAARGRRPGRPSVPSTDLRSQRLAFLLTEDEARAVKHAAACLDQTISDFCRDLTLAALADEHAGTVRLTLPAHLRTALEARARTLGVDVQSLVAQLVGDWLATGTGLPQ